VVPELPRTVYCGHALRCCPAGFARSTCRIGFKMDTTIIANLQEEKSTSPLALAAEKYRSEHG
jgi:hypothetical protein